MPTYTYTYANPIPNTNPQNPQFTSIALLQEQRRPYLHLHLSPHLTLPHLTLPNLGIIKAPLF